MDEPRTPTLTVDDGRATITLRRPTKRNRIEPDDLVAIDAHLTTIAENDAVRVVVIAAEGTVWCAGYHLGALAEGAATRVSFADVCDRIETLAVPTIAAMSGEVHGGGTDLGVSCDLRIGITATVLGMPAARIGLQYYPGGLRRFVQRVGASATKRIFLTGERIAAAELLRIGYLNEVVEPDQLGTRIDELCAAIAGLAPGAVASTKWAINELAGNDPDLERIHKAAASSARSAEHREGLAALAERRPAKW